MSTNFGPGLHVAPGRAVDASAYNGWVGRWSRLFVPTVLEAAEVKPGCRVLDVSTGTGEAASITLPIVGASGFEIGADISPAMLEAARERLHDMSFWPLAADGQAIAVQGRQFRCRHMPTRLAVLPRPRSRAERVPTRPSRWVRRSMCHLNPRPGTDVGYSRRCAQPFHSGAPGYNQSLFRAIRP